MVIILRVSRSFFNELVVLVSGLGAEWLPKGAADYKEHIVENLVPEEITVCLDETDFIDGIQDMMSIGLPGPSSKVDGLRQYLVPNIGAKLMLWNHIDRMIQKFRQGLGERQSLTEQVVAAREVHQEIHVAVRTFLTPHHGPEDTNAPSAIAPAQFPDEGFLGFQFVQ